MLTNKFFNNMKKEADVYVIYEETCDPTGENIRGFINIVSDAEEALEIITSSDKKLKYLKETIVVDVDVPVAHPDVQLAQRVVHPCKTWEDCYNKFKDCVNCPLRFGDLYSEFNDNNKEEEVPY